MTTNHIEFVYDGDGEPEETIQPKPGHEVIPEWFMKTPAIFDRGSKTGTTVKLCRAFTDALNFGYIIPAPEDITIDRFSDFSLQTDSDRVHIYGPTHYRNNGNSMYPVPELKIDVPWKIHTPEGYSSLVMKPLNRSLKGFEVNSMLIPTDQYNGDMSVPAVMGPRTHHIKKGDPLLSVIPFKRDEVLTHKNWSSEEKPDLTDRCSRIRRQLDTRKDLYRKVYHQEKPHGEVKRTREADITPLSESTEYDGDIDPQKNLGKRSETHDEHVFFITEEKNMGIIPGPYEPIEKAPPWIGDLTSHLDLTGLDDVAEEERFDEWMEAACSMGVIDVVSADVNVHQEEEYRNREAHTRFDKKLINPSIDEKIGPEFPFEMNITGVASDRFIGSADGYSTLMVDPLNHYSQYVRGFHGVVDHDLYYDFTNLPSMMYTDKPNFHVEKGSPHMQAIPFRRDSILETAIVTF